MHVLVHISIEGIPCKGITNVSDKIRALIMILATRES